jgi:hypothetical protein
LERGTDRLIHVSHVAAPDDLPKIMADAAAVFDGQDITIYLTDLQQRVLVPFQTAGHRSHDEFPHVLGVDATVAGRAFQQMQRLTQAAWGQSEDDRVSETATHIESAVNDVFRVESFATGLLCELDTTRGLLTWISAGHHQPLLLRDGRPVRVLEVEPLLPMGLNQQLSRTAPAPVGTEQLQPGDMLLFYTDGVIEARSTDGEFFGQDRLVDLVTRNLAAGLPAPETMRRVVHALLDHQGRPR